MHIMLAIDLAILYLIFREGGNSAPQFALSASYADCVSLLWRIFLTAVLAITGFAMVCFGRGLLVPAPFGVPGTRLVNWEAEYLTVLSNGPNGENKGKQCDENAGLFVRPILRQDTEKCKDASEKTSPIQARIKCTLGPLGIHTVGGLRENMGFAGINQFGGQFSPPFSKGGENLGKGIISLPLFHPFLFDASLIVGNLGR